MTAPSVTPTFNAAWFGAALAYYGHPLDFPATFRPNPAGYLEHCNPAVASRAGSPVWTTVNTPIASHLRRKAANDEIAVVRTITLEGEYPSDPPRAHALALALRAELERIGLIVPGTAIEDSGAGFHFALPITALSVAEYGGGFRVNEAVSSVVHDHIMPVFDTLAEAAGMTGLVTLGSFDISRIMSLPGTWRPAGAKPADAPSLRNGYQRRWLAPHDVEPPKRVESPALGYLVRRTCSLIREIHGSVQTIAPADATNAFDPAVVDTWLQGYASKLPKDDRSVSFHRLVCAAVLKYDAATVEAHTDYIDELMDHKYKKHALREVRRSLAKAPTKTELRAPLIREIHGGGVQKGTDTDPRNTRIRGDPDADQEIADLQAKVASLQAERNDLAMQLSLVQTRLEKFEAEALTAVVKREEARADMQEAAHKALVGILENPDLTFRQRIVTALAKDSANAYIPRSTFGELPRIPPPVHVAMRELEQRAGIAEGTAAQSLKPAAALGIITRETVKRHVKMTDGSLQVRTEVLIGPGTGQPLSNWRDRKREMEAERARVERAERKTKEDQLIARIDELEEANSRALQGCTCGGDLMPTGYFCEKCHNISTPRAVASFPKPIVLADFARKNVDAGVLLEMTGGRGVAVPLLPENVEPLLNSISDVYLSGRETGDGFGPDGMDEEF